MKKALAFILAMAMTASVALTGCGGTPTTPPDTGDTPAATDEATPATDPAATGTKASDLEGNNFVWNMGTESKTYDPALNSATDGSNVINNTFEGLMRDKNDGKGLQPAMATEMPTITDNEDGTQTYVFKLRDAKWSDGKPVTANDFAFAWKRLVDPATASEYAFIASPILNADEITLGTKTPDELAVKAIDDKTFEVILKQPTGYFLEVTGSGSFMPVREDVVDVDGLWAKDPAKAICNGPFKLTSFKMGSEAVFSKNENYWDAANVKVDNIIGKMIVEAGTYLTGFKNGEIDLIDTPPLEEIPQLVASGECKIAPILSNQFYIINQQTKVEALQNVKVRQAMSMAIDRKAIVESVTRGGQLPGCGILPYGFKDAAGKDFREEAGNYYLSETANVDGAKALLAEAGYPDGTGIPEFEVMINTNDSNKVLAEALQEMWAQIGIKVKISQQEWAVFQDTRNQLTYEAVARHAWNADYTDPQTFLDMFMTGNVQSGNGYSNPAYDEAMKKGMAAAGEQRRAAFLEAEKILIEDAYILPLYYGVRPVMANPKVQNWSVNSLSVYWFGDIEIAA